MSPSLQLANYPCALLKLPCKPHLSTNSWNFILLFLVTNVEDTCVVDSWRWCLRALNTNMWSWQASSCCTTPHLNPSEDLLLLWKRLSREPLAALFMCQRKLGETLHPILQRSLERISVVLIACKHGICIFKDPKNHSVEFVAIEAISTILKTALTAQPMIDSPVQMVIKRRHLHG